MKALSSLLNHEEDESPAISAIPSSTDKQTTPIVAGSAGIDSPNDSPLVVKTEPDDSPSVATTPVKRNSSSISPSDVSHLGPSGQRDFEMSPESSDSLPSAGAEGSVSSTASSTRSTSDPHQPKKNINRQLLRNKSLVKLAIRKKSTTRRPSKVSPEVIYPNTTPTSPRSSKSHFKPLEAGSRIRLTLVPSLTILYLALVPHTIRKEVKILSSGPSGIKDASAELFKNDILRSFASSLVSKPVKLIDDNLMNLATLSSKVLQTLHQNEHVPTFNSMDAAVSSLFGLKEYTAIRVTRAASSEPEGSILLKLETATPGHEWLIDDDDYSDDMLGSLGNKGDRPNSAFIKKVIARPRYKSDMKIYILPRATSASLYVDERMLERDLIKGIVDLEDPDRVLLTSFEYGDILKEYKNLVDVSKNMAEDPIDLRDKVSEDFDDSFGEIEVIEEESVPRKKRARKAKEESSPKRASVIDHQIFAAGTSKTTVVSTENNYELVSPTQPVSTHHEGVVRENQPRYNEGAPPPFHPPYGAMTGPKGPSIPQATTLTPAPTPSHIALSHPNPPPPPPPQIIMDQGQPPPGGPVMMPYMVQFQPVYYYPPTPYFPQLPPPAGPGARFPGLPPPPPPPPPHGQYYPPPLQIHHGPPEQPVQYPNNPDQQRLPSPQGLISGYYSPPSSRDSQQGFVLPPINK